MQTLSKGRLCVISNRMLNACVHMLVLTAFVCLCDVKEGRSVKAKQYKGKGGM